MAAKIDLKNLPPAAKAAVAVVPAVIISLVAYFMLISPKQKEIETLNAQIDTQNNTIAANQAKASKLDVLVKENEKLIKRLGELKEYLPEEKEISGLLKEISDRALDSGLSMQSWKPGIKKTHPSGIVYEIPVSITVTGTYHDFGKFLSSLTKLNRIVNIGNIQMGGPKNVNGRAVLQITFTASTFSAIPEKDLGGAKKTTKS